MNTEKTDKVVNSLFLLVVLVLSVLMIANIFMGRNAGASYEPATEPATEETTKEVTEPAETEAPTEAATEPTEPQVTLYDVPLSADLQKHIIERAEAHGIDPAIVMAMAWKESTYNPSAVGDNGNSIGLLQIQPRWHSARMQKLGCPDLFDPYQNVSVGVDYLAENINRYGSVEAALTAYNAGSYSGTVTQYAKSVVAMAAELRCDYVQ